MSLVWVIRTCACLLATGSIPAAMAAALDEGPPRSLFLTPAEQGTANASYQHYHREQHSELKTFPPDMRMAGLSVYPDGDWSFWLNGKIVTPQTVPPWITVKRVTRRYVDLYWKGPNAGKTAFVRLRPNQTYLGSTGIVVEGQVGNQLR
ncbi:MAG: hypothetical protein HQL37_00340 [Alphaproteobacteria bacterium]|nr:hypothetical protein [Alphaproteobacteria bacterium]